MTKRLVLTLSTIALAITGALIPNAASAESGDMSSQFATPSSDRGSSWKNCDTLRRGTSWE